MSQSQPPRNGMPEFYALLAQMADTHDRKSHDYASNTNPAGNYHFAGQIALLFSHSPQDAGFAGRIAEKLYRLSNLESSGKSALNETIEDTEVDIVTITALWMADRRHRRIKNQISAERFNAMSYQDQLTHLGLNPIESCNVHDKYEVGCKDCRSINGLI